MNQIILTLVLEGCWSTVQGWKYCRGNICYGRGNEKAVHTRHSQGWVDEVIEDLSELAKRVVEAKKSK